MFGGKFAVSSSLLQDDEGNYYVAQDNNILQYSHTFKRLKQFNPSEHMIKKLAFRLHSCQQIFVLVDKRVILYDLMTSTAVSSFEGKNMYIVDFQQLKEELIITFEYEKVTYIVAVPIKPGLSVLTTEHSLYKTPKRLFRPQLYGQHLICYTDNCLVMVNIAAKQYSMTEFAEQITAMHYGSELVVGFKSGMIFVLRGLPRAGPFSEQAERLDKHNEQVSSVQSLPNQILSCQPGQNAFGLWQKRDGKYQFSQLQTHAVKPLRMQALQQGFAVFTNANSVLIYSQNAKLIHQLSSVPQSKQNKLVVSDQVVTTGSVHGCVFKASLSFQNGVSVNLTDRDIMSATGSNVNVEVVDFDVIGDLTISIVQPSNSLIIYKGGQVLYNVYNVMPEMIFVRTAQHNNKLVLVVGGKYGFKIYQLYEDVLHYVCFKKLIGLQDLKIVGMDDLLRFFIVDEQNLYQIDFDDDFEVIKSEIYQISSLPQQLQCYATTEKVVVKLQHQLYVKSTSFTGYYDFSGLVAQNNISIFELQDGNIKHQGQTDILFHIESGKAQIMSFGVNGEDNFVVMLQTAQSRYLRICKDVEDEEYEDEQQIIPTETLTKKAEQVFAQDPMRQARFQSSCLSNQLESGRDIFSIMVE